MPRLKSVLLPILALTLALPASGDWATTDDTLGRKLSTGYGIDTVDHYSGKVIWTHTDYQLLLGQDSYLPISRRVEIDISSPLSKPWYFSYNLGQSLGFAVKSGFCSDIISKSMTPRFKGLNGETVQFTKHNRVGDFSDTFLSKNQWQLTCTSDDPGYPVQITSPNGIRFYYDDAPKAGTNSFHNGFPRLIKDANGNYARLHQKSAFDLDIETRFQTLSFDRDELSINGVANPLVKFEDISKGYRVRYVEDSSWTVRKTSSDTIELCNPLKTCVDFEFDLVRFKNWGATQRLVKKTYRIPHHGNYSINYDYDYDNDGKTLIVEARHSNHIREYKYYHNQSQNAGLQWRLGNLLEETVYDLTQSHKYQNTIYEYEASTAEDTSHASSADVGRYVTVPRLVRKVTKRWSNATDNDRYQWVGTVEVVNSDFDRYNNPKTVAYRYPDLSGGELYPSITYHTEWEYDLDIHRLGLVKRTSVEGLSYYTESGYDQVGNLTEVDIDGRVERFTYNIQGEKTSYTDAEGNQYSYSNFSFGIPRTESGPEGYNLTRTVKNGFIESETLYGNRTTKSTFDPFGKLIEYQPAESGREPLRYHYTFPTLGGMVLVEENGGLLKTTRFNGMGLPYQIEIKGTGSATGEAYHYIKYLEYYDDGTLKAESLPVDASAPPSASQYTRYSQDPVGRRIRLDPVDGDAITFQYNNPFETLMIDGAGVKTKERYRPFGGFGNEKLIERVHPRGNDLPSPELKLSLGYLVNGWLDTVTVGNKHHYYNYNATSGLLDSVFTPETGLIEFKYNANGQVKWEKRNGDTPMEYEYDGLGRLSSAQFADSATNVTYSYEDITRVKTQSKGAYTWRSEYDLDGNLTREYLVHDTHIKPPSVINTYPLYSNHTGRSSSGRSRQTRSTVRYGQNIDSKGYLDWGFRYHYDSKGFLARITYPDGEEVGYLPNALGRPTQAASYVTDVQYHPNGALRTLTYGNGRKLHSQQHANTGQLKEVVFDNLWSKRYQYSSAGYLSAIVDVDTAADSRYFEYDQLYQLKRVRSQSATGPVLETFAYTAAGDLTKRTSGSNTVTYQYDSQTNRLASVVIDGQTHLLGYTPDGRVTAYGQSDYAYTSDKHLAEFSEPDGGTYRYEYDANGRKVRVNVNNQLQRYTIHALDGRLMYEERPDETSTNFIYLNDQLVATRDTEYDLAYTECDYIENRAKRETLLYHRPVWLRRFDEEPVGYGDCERYGKWSHNYDRTSGTWEETSDQRIRRYHVWLNQYDSQGNNKGSLDDFKLYEENKAHWGNPERRYSRDGTWRYYKCYQRWRVLRYTYDPDGNLVGEGPTTESSGWYYTGDKKRWKWYQSKPSFSCGGPKLDPSKISWPVERR